MIFVSLLLNLFSIHAFADDLGGDDEVVASRVAKAYQRLEKNAGLDEYVTVLSDPVDADDKKSLERPDGSVVLDKEDSTGLTWRNDNGKNEWRVVNRERKQRAKITKRIIIKGTMDEVTGAYEFLKSNSVTQGIVGNREDMAEAGASIIDFPQAKFSDLKQAMRSLKEKGYKAEFELLHDRRFHAK